MADVSLNGEWTLYYCPEKGGKPDALSPELIARCERVPARVPGNVELDLMRAGVLPDLMYGENLYEAAPYEYCQWIYERELTVPRDMEPGRLTLRFDGLDTIADIYIDEAHVARCENMLVEHELDIDPYIKRGETRTLRVHIHSAMNYARGKSYTVAMRGTAHRNEICWLRKAPHMFGWDIMPRLVSAGIWRGCWLTVKKPTRFTEVYYATPRLENGAIALQYAYRFETDADTLQGFSVRVRGVCGDSAFEHELPAHFVSGNYDTLIPEPRLWWPKGYGDQPLYTVTMELLHDGEVVDSRTERIGLRALRLERRFTPGDQAVQIYVNDVPIFIMGTNWVPLSPLHSQDAERLPRAFELLDESGCNCVRCWGGNVYESDAFYDMCDQAGILVWQDFAMGNTNYPQTDEFVPALEFEIGALLRRLRNHACVLLWSSDNEVDLKNTGYMYPTYDSRHNRVAHDTLRRLVQAHDPYRYYLCSSPEIPEGFSPTDVPEQHTWGPRAWFKDDFYRLCSARFIGEAGYHGCPAPESIRRFIPPESVWPFENRAWAMHSTEDVRIEPVTNGRNRLMQNQVKLMFGEAPDDLERFAALSQISQAEALKFFIEHSRALKWRRSGIIWWNLLDGWPQISDAVVDYYFVKKRAFDYIKRAQRSVTLFCDEMQGWSRDVLAANDTRSSAHIYYTVSDVDTGDTLLQGEAELEPGALKKLGAIPAISSEQRLLLLKWRLNGIEHRNHYITGMPPYDADGMLFWAELIDAMEA